MPSGDLQLPELNPIIHAQARLQIMTVLCALPRGDRIAFPRLQEMLGLSAGNLSTHLSKLEEAGYAKVEKAFRGRTPVTWICVTDQGRRAMHDYLNALRAYLDR